MTNAYAPSILRQTLCRDSQFNKQNHHPMKRLKCICAVSAFLLFLGLFAPRVAWGQFQYYNSGSWTDTPNLQTAIDNSSAGGTIYVYGTEGKINNDITVNQNITLAVYYQENYGSVRITRTSDKYITIKPGKTLTIKNIIIDGNNVGCRFALLTVEGTLIMEGRAKTGTGYDPNNCKIINCEKSNNTSISGLRNGSAISVRANGRFECNSVTFENNKNRDIHPVNEGKAYGGGALAFHRDATFSLTNCIFNNNEAYESAGAIFLEYAGSGEINNCTFDGNISYWAGGAIYGILNDGATINITGATTFRNNQVNYSNSLGLSQPEFLGLGGAIYFLSGKTCTFNIGDGSNTVSFENNYARYCGGAICIFCEYANSHFNLRKFSMTGNHTNDNGYVPRPNATDGGGALYIFGSEEDDHADDHIVIRNGTISNNYAVNHGGAMLVTMHDSEVQDVTFEGNYTTASESKGGAVKIIGKDHNYTHTNSFIRCDFFKNGINGSTTMTKYGGALYSVNETNVEILGCIIGGSEANANKAIADGGGIYIGEDSYLTMDSQVATGSYNTMEVSYNEAGNDGGGIYVANGSQGHTNIGSNSNVSYPVKINNNEAAFNGGGIALHCSGTANDLFTLRNFELKNNRALQGGGAYLQGGHISGVNHGAMTINNGTVQGNHAASAGGGIYFDEHDANVSYVNFIYNRTNKGTTSSSYGIGGGVLVAGHSNHAVEDHDHDFYNCTFKQNQASVGGAAMIIHKTNATFSECTIGGSVDDKNTASINGGGVYVEELSKADFINGTEVSYNEAVNGGGVYINGPIGTGSNNLSIDCGASINVYPYEQMGEYFGIYTKNESGVYELVAGTDMSLTGSTSSVINVSNLQAETDYYVRTKLLGSYITDDYSWYYQIQCELSGITGKIRIYDTDWNTYVDYTEPYHWNKPARAKLSGAAYSHSMETIAANTYFYDIIHFRVVPASETNAIGEATVSGGSNVRYNTATGDGGGVYKRGTLKVEGQVTITDNQSGSAMARVINNVHIPVGSADGQAILITGDLTCGSSIGVTKIKSTDSGATNHLYADDDNFTEVRTVIAKVEPASSPQSWALDAYRKSVFFDDTDKYGVWSFNYHKTTTANDYSDQNDYFIETWRNFADASGFASNTVSTPAGLAHFAKLVNTGNAATNAVQNTTIDLSGHYWEPIGFTVGNICNPASDNQFSGSYNGNGHFILNAMSILPAQDMGLFGKVTGTVKHTFLYDGELAYTFEGTSGSLGGIAGSAVGGTIDGCEVADVALIGYSASNSNLCQAGGIAGIVSGEVRNSFTSGNTFTGTLSNTGGLVGQVASGGAVKNCYTKINTLAGTTQGALVGKNSGTLSNCYTSAASGKVVGSGSGTNLYSAGASGATTYTATIGADQLGYMYADNLVGKTPLFEQLTTNAQALGAAYDLWARPALAYYVAGSPVTIEKPINDDLPVLLMDNYDGSRNIGAGGFRTVSNYNGLVDVLQYGGPNRDGNQLDGTLARSTGSDSHFIYGDISAAPAHTPITANRISIYEHAAITQAGTLGSFDKTHVSITFDNSAGELSNASTLNINDLPELSLPRDWHLLSTPLNNAPLGFDYKNHNAPVLDHTDFDNLNKQYDVEGFYNNPWQNGGTANPNNHGGTEFGWLGNTANTGTNSLNRYWMKGWTGSQSNTDGGYANIDLNDVNIGWKDGYFPSTFDATLHDFNQGCIQTADENGRYPYGMDFYSWTEPNYHYINFKRNGPNHWHSDEPHVHLDYTPETASNYASPQENVNEEILLAGKGYFASIAEKTLLQSSGQLGTGTNNNKTIGVTCSTYPNTVPIETGWNLVGNPFHAYLDFNEFCKDNTGVNNTYIVYNADGFQKEDEDSFTYGNGFSYYVAEGSQHGAYASQYLHPHQGFFVKVNEYEENTPTPTLTFKESHTTLRSDLTANDGSYRNDNRRPTPW